MDYRLKDTYTPESLRDKGFIISNVVHNIQDLAKLLDKSYNIKFDYIV